MYVSMYVATIPARETVWIIRNVKWTDLCQTIYQMISQIDSCSAMNVAAPPPPPPPRMFLYFRCLETFHGLIVV